jgi:uncharacterized protein
MLALDPLTATAIRVGHRELLDTLRELAGGLDPCVGSFDESALRGTLAFLRHEVIPFARWEEAAIPPGERWEDTAFEHAFVAVETDALAREIEVLLGARSSQLHPALRGVCRRLDRIEAVLELHALKEEERDIACVEPQLPRPEAQPPAAGSRAMGEEEIAAFLAERRWGLLAISGDGAPYAVPVSFGWDGCDLYLASGPGRKLDHLRESGAACLTVVDVTHGELWRSVVARGRTEPVAGINGRLRAIRLLARARGPGAPRREDLQRLMHATFFRLRPEELTGRARGESSA